MFAHSGHVMTLANSIIGVGILAMPFCFQKCGIILSILLLILSNWITRICCHYLIKISLLTRRKSIEFLGFHAFGSSGKLLVELCIIGYLIGTCITYFVVIGDLGPQIVTKMFHLNEPHRHLRTLVMCIVTLACVLPLGMLKNVDSLSTICTASIGFYVCLVLKIILESGTHIMAQDWTDKVVYWEPAGVLQCLPIISMALSCQMQIFEVFSTINNQSLEKLNGIVRNATWICTFVYIAVGFFGYVAFCTQSFSGNILVNLAPSFGSDVIKIGFVLSVAFSFPLVIFPCRASIYSLLYRKGHTDNTAYIPESRFKMITTFIVGFALCVALMIPSVELIIGLVGSTIGVAICVMFPAASFRKIILKNTNERNLAQLVLVSGFCLMILGTYANLNAIDEQSSGMHTEELSHLQDYNVKMTQVPLPKDIYKIETQHKPVLQGKEPLLELRTLEKHPPNEHKEQALKKNQNLVEPIAAQPTPADAAALFLVTNKIDNKLADLKNEKQANIQMPAKVNDTLKIPQPSVVLQEPKAPTTAQQTIDKEALKANEEIIAEEQKAEEKLSNKNEQLKQTQELIERTFDELKVELAKQNQETQNLVVEKINKMVEKVEQIERKVQLKEDAQLEEQQKDKQQAVEQQLRSGGNETNAAKQETSQLASIIENQRGEQLEKKVETPKAVEPAKAAELNEQKKVPLGAENKPADVKVNSALLGRLKDTVTMRAEELEAHAGVYEPKSYKTGELLTNVKQAAEQPEQRLPPSLALLFNASQAKLNESNKVKPVPVPAQKLVAYEPSQPAIPPPPTPSPAVADEADAEAKLLAKQAVTAKASIEAIRRDLLQLNTADMPNMQETTLTSAQALNNKRAKRNVASDLVAATMTESKASCLTEPQLSDMLQHGMSSGILELQKQTIGRNLMSVVAEQDLASTTTEQSNGPLHMETAI